MALQEPPLTVDSTVTCVPAVIVAAVVSAVDGPVRSRTPSQAAAIVVPARAGRADGGDRAMAITIAARSAGAIRTAANWPLPKKRRAEMRGATGRGRRATSG